MFEKVWPEATAISIHCLLIMFGVKEEVFCIAKRAFSCWLKATVMQFRAKGPVGRVLDGGKFQVEWTRGRKLYMPGR